jgi:hypothetical protein
VVPYHPGIQRFTHALKTLFHRRHYQTRCSARHQIETQERDAKFHTPRVKLCRSRRHAWPGHAKTGGVHRDQAGGRPRQPLFPGECLLLVLPQIDPAEEGRLPGAPAAQ